MIVGIDPGVYTAYSILDLDGNTVKTGCAKELSHEGLVKIISSFGKPSLVATDVSPAPGFVLRIASRFHVRVFSPQRSLQVEEKKKIAKGVQDAHIRDAYAASVKAYRNYENTLRRISGMDTSLDKDELKHLFLQGHKVSEAQFILEKKSAKPASKTGDGGATPLRQPASGRDSRMLALLSENENLRKALEIERERNSSLEEKLGRASSTRSIKTSVNREVQRLQGQIARMQVYISRLKRRKGAGKKMGGKRKHGDKSGGGKNPKKQ